MRAPFCSMVVPAQVYHVVHVGVHHGLAGQVHPLKLKPVAHRGGAKRHGGLHAGVQPNAAHRHGRLNGVLLIVHEWIKG